MSAADTAKPCLGPRGAPGSALTPEGLQISAAARAEAIGMMADDGKNKAKCD